MKDMKTSIKNEQGITLLELLLSITILMIIITVFFQFFSQSAANTVKNEEKLTAINVVRETVSEIKGLNNKNDFLAEFPELVSNNCTTRSENPFNVTICLDEGPIQDLKKVKVAAQHDQDLSVKSETYTYVKWGE